jgi:hypothetical protein
VTVDALFDFVRQGGAYVAPLLLLALIWMTRQYARALEENKEKDERLAELSMRLIEVATELKVFLFNERKT